MSCVQYQYATVNTPHWTALVIFYVISLHTVANHSDDNYYHTAVNIINCKHSI